MTRQSLIETYTLENAQSPDFVNGFEHPIPSREDRENLRGGDLVKLIFQYQGRSEHMWVQVVDWDAGEYIGRLDNHPSWIPLEADDLVRFRAEHVVKLDRAKVVLQ
jgi:hypothetical protein